LVGAGGAVRAFAFGLADEGMAVRIANRTESKAYDLAEDVPDASGHGLDELDELLADADVLVNCTSVGMDEDETPVPETALHGDLAVLDAVYTPIETRLLRDAAAVGATTVDGAWMLLYQGVEAFERWTGEDAPVKPMNEALREQL
jgi:shikimate dehydrogenase